MHDNLPPSRDILLPVRTDELLGRDFLPVMSSKHQSMLVASNSIRGFGIEQEIHSLSPVRKVEMA